MKPYELKYFEGDAILPHLEEIARWRIRYFREFPYLYEGTLEYEMEHLNGYAKSKDAILVLAFYGAEIVAFSTAAALLGEFSIVSDNKNPFLKSILPEKTVYFGEIIINPPHRGKGLCRGLFVELETYYKNMHYDTACFLTVDRNSNHKLRPVDYQNPEIYWNKMGYLKTEFTTSFSWPTILEDGNVEEQENLLNFWVKKIV